MEILCSSQFLLDFKNYCNAHLLALLADLQSLFSLVWAYPLYSAYLIFLTPYLVQLLSFLSPLLISTSLFLMVYLTFSPHLQILCFQPPENPDPTEIDATQKQDGFLAKTAVEILESLRENLGVNADLHFLEAVESMEAELGFSPASPELGFSPESPELGFSVGVPATSELGISIGVPAATVTGVAAPEPIYKGGVAVESWANGGDGLGSSFGSMRKTKEWKRTLACKLYEEKQNKWKETLGGKLIVDGFGGVAEENNGEGMDLLWEVYEDDLGRAKSEMMVKKSTANEATKENKNTKKPKKIHGKKSSDFDQGKLGNVEFGRNEKEEEEDDDDDDEEGNSQLCCLSALRFSTGKMSSLGMGRPNLLKFSKALKGFGLFRSLPHRKERK